MAQALEPGRRWRALAQAFRDKGWLRAFGATVGLSLAFIGCDHSPTEAALKGHSSLAGLDEWLEAQAEKGARTQALIVKRGDQILAEIYREDFGPQTPSQLYSMSKSLTSLGIGAAVRDFGFDLGASICTWLDAPPEAAICESSLESVLQMSSGLEWTEDYSGSKPSDVLNMLYGSGSLDMGAYILGRSREASPGDLFRYSSGDTTILSLILKGLTGGDTRSYFAERVFEPMGLDSLVWEEDHAGTLVGAAGVHMTARDIVKMGETLLSEEKRAAVVSQDYFERSLTPVVVRRGQPTEKRERYGYQWWLNSSGAMSPWAEDDPTLWRYPSGTAQTYAALGHFGQMLVVIPEEDTIIARLGSDKIAGFDLNGLIALVRTGELPKPPGRGDDGPTEPPEILAVSVAMGPLVEVEPALGFTALTYCTCRFVSGRTHDACLERVQVPGQPDIPVELPSSEEPVVRTEAGGLVKQARYLDVQKTGASPQAGLPVIGKGCQLVP